MRNFPLWKVTNIQRNNVVTMNSEGARWALDDLKNSRAGLADQVIAPWWYDWSLAGIVAGLMLGQLGGPLTGALVTVAMMGLLAALVQIYKQKRGVWVSGFYPGRTKRIAGALGLIVAVAFVAGIGLHYWLQAAWPILIGAAAAFVAVLVFSRLWAAAYRKQMGEAS